MRKIKKEFSVAFINEKLREKFEVLKLEEFESKKLYDFINRAINDLKQNPFYGIKIPKRLWPKEYVQKYKITNLWKYNLPNAWRVIYTLETDEVRIISIILEWMNHKEYERRFGY